jgi:hypothetical protein
VVAASIHASGRSLYTHNRRSDDRNLLEFRLCDRMVEGSWRHRSRNGAWVGDECRPRRVYGITVGVAGGVARGGIGVDVAVGSAIGVICAALSTLFGATRRSVLLGAAFLLLCITVNELVFGNGLLYARSAGIAFATTLALRTWEHLVPPHITNSASSDDPSPV